jgi:hypothetical protein
LSEANLTNNSQFKDKIWKERCRFSKFYQILPSIVLNVLKEFNDSLFPLKIYMLFNIFITEPTSALCSQKGTIERI